MAKIHFPDRWPGFLRDFLGLLSTGNLSNAADMFCRVLDAVDETCVCGAFGDAFDQRCAARVKDAMRNDAVALTQLVDAFATLIACPDLKIATAATSTAMRYVDWMDVSLFTSVRTQSNPPQSQSIADAARVALTSPNSDRRAAGCAFFTSLVAKGMDHSQKIELITGLRLVDVCAHLHAVSIGDEDEDAAVCAAQLTAAVGHELLSCLRAGDAAAGADQTEPHAASPPTQTLTQAALLTDTLMPTGVAHLRNNDERVVAAALPLCAAYVHRLKADRGSSGGTIEGKKRDNGVVQVSRDTGGFGFGDGGVLGFGGVLGAGLSQSPRSAFAIAHTRPAKGRLTTRRAHSRRTVTLTVFVILWSTVFPIPHTMEYSIPFPIPHINPGYTHHDRLTLSFLSGQEVGTRNLRHNRTHGTSVRCVSTRKRRVVRSGQSRARASRAVLSRTNDALGLISPEAIATVLRKPRRKPLRSDGSWACCSARWRGARPPSRCTRCEAR